MVEAPATKLEGNGLMWEAVGATVESHASFEPAEVLADLERDGVFGAVLINRSLAWDDSRPLEVDVAYCELVNDWTAEHWGPYLDRVAPGIVLPLADVAASVTELERCAAKGMRPALLADGMINPAYNLPEWEPLWEALSALKIPATLHVGTRQMPQMAPETMAAMGEGMLYAGMPMVGWYNQCFQMGETLGQLLFSGVFERHPDLHVVMTEGYAGWLAFAMQFFDHHCDGRFRHEHPVNSGPLGRRARRAAELLPQAPGPRHVHVGSARDQVRHLTGIDCLLWGNDYPHPEGSFPHSQEWNDKQFAGVPEDEIDAIVRGNAANLFGIDVLA